MAGGKFDARIGKTRPGTYINFESTRQDLIGGRERGKVLIPLIEHDYGPAKEFIKLTTASPDAARVKLGYSVYSDNPNMLLIREAFKNSGTVIVYIPSQGSAATGTAGALTATAKYGGARGNSFKVTIAANPVKGFDVTVFLDTEPVSKYEKLTTIEELIAQDDEWIKFSGTGNLTANAGLALSGGTTSKLSAGDISAFLDASETVQWNTLAFPLAATGESGDPAPALFSAVKSKIKYLREEVGKPRKAVVAKFAGDYEGLINVTNSVELMGGVKLTLAQVTAWVAGADAGASNTTSNTYLKYEGAVNIVGQKNNEEAIAAINNGEFFFSFSEEGDVVVEYDINSLTTFKKPKDETYRKNRVLRVFDTFAESLMLNFPPNKYDNNPDGWDIMEGVGKAILKQFKDAGSVKNVDYETDFKVDRSLSTGDQTFFNVGLEPVDSSEKLFFTIKTR